MKRVLAGILSLVFLFSLLTVPAHAASATVSITSSAGTVYSGGQFSVTIRVSADEPIGSWMFSLSYSADILEYVSGADGGGGGAVRFADSLDTGVGSITKTVIFRAKKIGKATLSVSNPQIVGFDSLSNLRTSGASRTVNVVAAPTLSGDNILSDLSISPGELSPAFSPNETAYSVSVPFEISSVTVGATPRHSAASVSVSETDLIVGENEIKVTVTAQNGSARVYTLKVTREESDLAGATAEHEGRHYQIAYDPSALTPPEGFTPSTFLYRDQKILVYLSPGSPGGAVMVVYLVSEEHSAWFVLDPETQTFSNFVSVRAEANPFVIVTPPESIVVPGGFIPEEELLVGEVKVSAWKSSRMPENLYLVYAMNKEGNIGFYFYDSKNVAFVSFFESDYAISSGAEQSPEVLMLQLEEERAARLRMEIIALILAILAVLMMIGSVLVFIYRRRGKTVPMQDDVPLDEELVLEKEIIEIETDPDPDSDPDPEFSPEEKPDELSQKNEDELAKLKAIYNMDEKE